MNATKYLRGECQHCGGHIEFPAEAAGTALACPHCGRETELFLSANEAPRRASLKTVVFIALAIVILAGGLLGALWALNRAKRLAGTDAQPAAAGSEFDANNPFARQHFAASEVALEKPEGRSVVHATGAITNLSAERRFGVRVQVELLDDAGTALGTATDYTATLDPRAIWQFKALVLNKAAVAGRVLAISEDP